MTEQDYIYELIRVERTVALKPSSEISILVAINGKSIVHFNAFSKFEQSYSCNVAPGVMVLFSQNLFYVSLQRIDICNWDSQASAHHYKEKASFGNTPNWKWRVFSAFSTGQRSPVRQCSSVQTNLPPSPTNDEAKNGPKKLMTTTLITTRATK